MTPARNVSGFSKLYLVLTFLLFSIGESEYYKNTPSIFYEKIILVLALLVTDYFARTVCDYCV